MPFLLEAAVALATFVHLNHIVYLCSWMNSLSSYLQLQVV
ncbi:RNA polymerase subunit sigma-70 [Vibrio cholerae]|nr:RNA polymerase subunit sigma-70 [Vibrio cholerae]